MEILHDSEVSKIVYDPKHKIVYKTLKQKNINTEWLTLYKQFQKTARVVKVIDIVDKNTYSMEYIPNILTTVEKFTESWRPKYSYIRNKSNFINLHNTFTDAWKSAMAISKTLPEKYFWSSGDLKLANIVVLKDKKDNISFKIIDADSWAINDGYHSVDTFYQSQLKIALIMQRIVN